ncbi:uncharacterized protein TrAtP1_001281 [Trichoderma atroviride]|uniref:uncharacterized protein n=1 Tax=Hypocrea atroviridis TaxID=63577 RepID=UPI003330EE16|nr:hypothetical protein TrAtP1_001281 [Trichoderma atroviride]
MRFGRNFQRSQVPAWRESYVDYSRLKALVNTKPALEDLKEAVRHEISIIESFLRVQGHEISAQIEALNEHWGTNIGRTKLPPQYRGVSTLELEDLQTSLIECAYDVAKCHHYIKFNYDALSRILNKATALFNAEELFDINLLLSRAKNNRCSHHPWLPELNTALKLVREAKENKESNAPSRSLLLEQYGMHHFPPEIRHCLQEDDGARLEAVLNRQYQTPSPEKQSAIARLVHVAFTQRSSNCQHVLLSSLQSNPQKPFHTMGSEDYLHQVIQQLARSEASSSSLSAASAFHRVLELLHPTQLPLLRSQDSLGRLPLHHAARLGLDGVCLEIICAIRYSTVKAFQEQVRMCADVFGRTPLDYAVRHGHLAVVGLLISEHKCQTSSNGPNPVEKLDILVTAISSNFTDIAMRLIQEGWGFQFVSRSGKNILHLVSEHGSSVLIKNLVALGVDVNARENDRGWTPLITACVLGHTVVVKALLQAGADARIHDRQGWLGKDHAAYRGHIDIMNTIQTSGSLFLPSKHGNHLCNKIILPRRSSTDSVIFIYLGTLDLLKITPEVNITPYRARISPAQIPDTYLDLSISLIGGNSPEHIVPLPFISENSDRPWCFTTNDMENAAVIFKLTSPLEEKPIGAAIALLKSLKGGLGANHESLIRDFTIPPCQ